MLTLESVTKAYQTKRGRRTVLNSVNFAVAPGEKVGVLGRNGAGKSTLIRLVSGAESPSSGKIRHGMSVSWPLAFGGAFQGGLTGLDNVRFVCRIYGADIKRVLDFVEDFSELGAYMHEPLMRYSSGMRARFAFALSMAIDFDCLLIDEIVAVGDKRFHDKCHSELFEKRKDKSWIIVSHDPRYIREHCKRASVLDNGQLHNFDDVESAYQFYEGRT